MYISVSGVSVYVVYFASWECTLVWVVNELLVCVCG